MACKTDEDFEIIEDKTGVVSTLSKIKSQDLLAVDCEGVSLGRNGELTVLIIATTSKVFIFDILKIGKDAFDGGLRNLLEDTRKEKLMFDCRRDSDVLWHHYKVKLAGVTDLQLMEVMCRMEKTSRTPKAIQGSRRSTRKDGVESVFGYRRCLELYIGDKVMIDQKEKGSSALYSDKAVWKKRPISEDLINYCKVDTSGMFSLYEKLRENVEDIPRLKVASQRYVDLLRDLPARSNDEYENHAYLPLDIIPEKGRLDFPFASTKCIKCHRLFPREEFSKNQLRKNEQKCRVCKNIKLRIDGHMKRNDNLRSDERVGFRTHSDDTDTDFHDTDSFVISWRTENAISFDDGEYDGEIDFRREVYISNNYFNQWDFGRDSNSPCYGVYNYSYRVTSYHKDYDIPGNSDDESDFYSGYYYDSDSDFSYESYYTESDFDQYDSDCEASNSDNDSYNEDYDSDCDLYYEDYDIEAAFYRKAYDNNKDFSSEAYDSDRGFHYKDDESRRRFHYRTYNRTRDFYDEADDIDNDFNFEAYDSDRDSYCEAYDSDRDSNYETYDSY